MSNSTLSSPAIIFAKTVDIYVPSLKKILSFKNLTVKQYKTCLTMRFNIEEAADETTELFKFVVYLAEIVQENCLSSESSKVLLADLPAIILKLRAFSDDKLAINTPDQGILEIALESHIKLKTEQLPSFVPSQEIKNEVATVTLTAPTLEEYVMLAKAIEQLAGKNTEPGDVFLIDFVKFLSKISNKDKSVNIDFRSLPLADQLEIVYSLDFSLILNSKDFIKQHRAFFNHFLYFDKFQQPILLDLTPRLFTGL